MRMLSNRLMSLVKYIDDDDNIIDIGCDHALLDIYLIQNHIVPNMIASDIHKQALEQGKKNIKAAKISKKIDLRLGNGLEVLKNTDKVNTILISGMGTKTILDILASPHLKKIDKLVIQSNNNHFELREGIINLGYYIKDEEYFVDNDKNYINIVFEKGYKKYTKAEIKYGPILLHDSNYLNFEINNCLKIKEFLPKKKIFLRFSLNQEINKLKKYRKRVL